MIDTFDPMRNLFPIMDCRDCGKRNPLVFYGPKPMGPGKVWCCMCYDCVEKRGWINPRTGNLRDDVSF